MIVWIHLQALAKNSPQCGLLDTQPCTISGLRGAMLKAFLTCFTLSSEGPDRPGRFAMHRHPSRWKFLMPPLVFLIGGSFPNLIRKLLCTATIDCVLALSSTQKASSAHVAVIFTYPPPWRPTTKLSARGMCNKPGEFLYVGCMLSPFRHASVLILRNVPKNYNNSVFKQNTCKEIAT